MSDFKLDDHPKISSGLSAPQGYFDAFPEKMMARLNQEPHAKVIPLYARRKNWGIAAAAVLAVALAVPLFQNDNNPNTALDDSSIENYITYQSNISQYDLVGLLDDADMDKMEAHLPIEDETIEDLLISNNNFENYIID